MNIEDLGITREEIINLAAQKLADAYHDEDDLSSIASKEIKLRVGKALDAQIDAVLMAEMERIMGQEITPINMWGERAGAPTTIRASLADRAKDFWITKVDSEGKSGSYGANKARAEWLFEKVCKEQFAEAVKQDITNLVGAFKDALSESCKASVQDHINTLLKVKTKTH